MTRHDALKRALELRALANRLHRLELDALMRAKSLEDHAARPTQMAASLSSVSSTPFASATASRSRQRLEGTEPCSSQLRTVP